MTMWYRTGTASVNNGSASVTGTLTAWTNNVLPGDAISFDAGAKWYEVLSVEDNTALTLNSNFGESNVTGGNYSIMRLSPQWSLASELSVRVGALLAATTDVLSGSGAPSDLLGSDGSLYFDISANALYGPKSGGSWGSPFGYGTLTTLSIGGGTFLTTKVATSGVIPNLQVNGTDAPGSSLLLSRFTANEHNPVLHLAKSRGSSVGSYTVLQAGDVLGAISFAGADGTDFAEGARIAAVAEGTIGAGAMPSSIRAYTSGAGSETPSERWRTDSSGNFVLGGLAATSSWIAAGGFAPRLQNHGAAQDAASMGLALYAASSLGPVLFLAKSRHGTAGSHTIGQDGDTAGSIQFSISNGTNFSPVASILAQVDGSPSATNDMPGRLLFYTTPNASDALVERMRINNAGLVGIGSTAPAARLHVYEPTGLGTTATDSQLVATISGSNENGAHTRFLLYRTGNGSDHETAENRIQRRIDVTDQHYIGFGSTYLSFGTSSAELMRVTSTDVLIGTTSSISTNSIFEVDRSTNGNHYILVRNANSGSSARSGIQFGNDVNNVAGAVWMNGSNTVDYAGANSINMSTVVDGPIGLVTNNTLRVLVHSWSSDPGYGVISLNGSRTGAGVLGLVGGKGGDTNLYYMVASGGVHTFRVDNTDEMQVSASGVSIVNGLRVGFTGTPTDDAVAVGDGNFVMNFNSGVPLINFDANDYFAYSRTSNFFQGVIGGGEKFRFDGTATARDTAMMLWDVDNGALERVTVGDPNSGGTNFKVLRIPN